MQLQCFALLRFNNIFCAAYLAEIRLYLLRPTKSIYYVLFYQNTKDYVLIN